jgi:amino acid permease
VGLQTVVSPLEVDDWFHVQTRELTRLSMKKGQAAGVASSVFNMANTGVGPSTLAMSLVLAQMGWLLGACMLLLITTLSVHTSMLLARVSLAEDTKSYDATIKKLLGPFWLHVYQTLVVISTMGAFVAIMIQCGDFVQTLAWQNGSNVHRTVAIVIPACFMLPLALLRRIHSLRIASYLSVVFATILVVVLVAKAAESPSPTTVAARWHAGDFAQGFSLTVLAFSTQTYVVPLMQEVRHKTEGTIFKICSWNAVIAFVFRVATGCVGCSSFHWYHCFLRCSLVAPVCFWNSIAGYARFGESVSGNVLKDFPKQPDSLVALAVASFLIKFVFTYPMLNVPCRVTVHYLFCGETTATTTQHVLTTALPFLLSLAVACIVTDVGVLFSFIGALSRTSVFFLYPAALTLVSKSLVPLRRAQRLVCYLYLVLGSVCMLSGVAFTLPAMFR